jgi:hypothetical protein
VSRISAVFERTEGVIENTPDEQKLPVANDRQEIVRMMLLLLRFASTVVTTEDSWLLSLRCRDSNMDLRRFSTTTDGVWTDTDDDEDVIT